MLLTSGSTYGFGDFELRPAARTLECAGEKVALGAKAFDLLVCLVENAGQVVSRDQLMKAAWPDSHVEETNLSQHVFALRRALAGSAECIVTVPGRGYLFTAAVRRSTLHQADLYAPREETMLPALEQHRAPVGRAHTRRMRLAPLLLVVPGLLAAGSWSWLHREAPGDHHEVILAAFENATGEPQFDGALQAALAIDLDESPYLLLASQSRMRDTLKLMERSPDDRIAGAVAREVCQRMNDQAVLTGHIGRVGRTYLVTLIASDCQAGMELMRTRSVARGADQVLTAVDSAAAEMRRRLGEPLGTLRHFDTPLTEKMTQSLEALRLYSRGSALLNAGKYGESLPLLRQAVALDPHFAAAHVALGTAYFRSGEYSQGVAAFDKGYEMRAHATERDRLQIQVQHVIRTSEAETIMQALKAWADAYPNDVRPALSLADGYNAIGQYENALGPGRRAVSLDPTNGTAYEVLTLALMQAGHLDEAKAVARQAVEHKADGATLHEYLVDIAFLERDWAEIGRQVAWAKDPPAEAHMLLVEALIDGAQGKARAEEDMSWKAAAAYRSLGMAEFGERLITSLPRDLANFGLIDRARTVLQRVPKADSYSDDYIVALAITGEIARAEKDALTLERDNPHDSITQRIRIPQMKAAVALARSQPERAIAELEPAALYDACALAIPSMRGAAYLKARQPALAAAQFRMVVEHPFIDPASATVPLAHLGLARALAMQGDFAGSRQEYETFLALWKDADADLPPLKAARAELAALAR